MRPPRTQATAWVALRTAKVCQAHRVWWAAPAPTTRSGPGGSTGEHGTRAHVPSTPKQREEEMQAPTRSRAAPPSSRGLQAAPRMRAGKAPRSICGAPGSHMPEPTRKRPWRWEAAAPRLKTADQALTCQASESPPDRLGLPGRGAAHRTPEPSPAPPPESLRRAQGWGMAEPQPCVPVDGAQGTQAPARQLSWPTERLSGIPGKINRVNHELSSPAKHAPARVGTGRGHVNSVSQWDASEHNARAKAPGARATGARASPGSSPCALRTSPTVLQRSCGADCRNGDQAVRQQGRPPSFPSSPAPH